MKNLTIEDQYQLYLKKIGMKEAGMNSIQRKQLRQAFFGASGMLLLTFRDVLTKMPENKAIAKLDAMFKEASDFWEVQQ
jgi:hypothetical protein